MPYHPGSQHSPVKQNSTPKKQSVLIAIGHLGRLVLWEQERQLTAYDKRVLVIRRTGKPFRHTADVVLQYDRHHREVWADLRRLIFCADCIAVVGAAGGRAGSMLTLQLAREIHWTQKPLSISLTTPFSWEDRRRYLRALYVIFRLRQMNGYQINVVHTKRIEGESRIDESLDATIRRLTCLVAVGVDVDDACFSLNKKACNTRKPYELAYLDIEFTVRPACRKSCKYRSQQKRPDRKVEQNPDFGAKAGD